MASYPYVNKAITAGDTHTVMVGRYAYLASNKSARPDSARGDTSFRHFVRKGRASYVNDVLGGRRTAIVAVPLVET